MPIKYRGKVLAMLYGKSKGGKRKPGGSLSKPYPFYRLIWTVGGRRMMKAFRLYGDAKRHAVKGFELNIDQLGRAAKDGGAWTNRRPTSLNYRIFEEFRGWRTGKSF